MKSNIKRKKGTKAQKSYLKFFITLSPGSRIIVIALKNKEYRNGTTLTFLVDFYKIGLKDYYSTEFNYKRVLREFEEGFDEIDKTQAITYLVRGYIIAMTVGTPVSPGCQFWLEKFGVTKYRTKGSIYKCFVCDQGDLSDSQVKSILEIAKKELISGVAGTIEEKKILEYCKSCNKERSQPLKIFLNHFEFEQKINEPDDDVIDRTYHQLMEDSLNSIDPNQLIKLQTPQINTRSEFFPKDIFVIKYLNEHFFILKPFIHLEESILINNDTDFTILNINEERVIQLQQKEYIQGEINYILLCTPPFIPKLVSYLNRSPYNEWIQQSKSTIQTEINKYLKINKKRNMDLKSLEVAEEIIMSLIETVECIPDSRIIIFPFFIDLISTNNIGSDLVEEFFNDVYNMDDDLSLRELLIFKDLKDVMIDKLKKEVLEENEFNIVYIYTFIFLNNAYFLKNEAIEIVKLFNIAKESVKYLLSSVMVSISNVYPELLIPIKNDIENLDKDDENITILLEAMKRHALLN